MKYLVVPDDDGQYVNQNGEHFNVIYGGYVVGPRASEFKEFDTLKHALEYYNLTDTNAPTKILAYKKEESPAGTYQDKEGERYNILSQSFEEVPEGWTAFESEEEAAAAWDLTPVEEE